MPVKKAIGNNNNTARIKRIEIIVSGEMKSRRYFVAMKDMPQNIIAGTGSHCFNKAIFNVSRVSLNIKVPVVNGFCSSKEYFIS